VSKVSARRSLLLRGATILTLIARVTFLAALSGNHRGPTRRRCRVRRRFIWNYVAATLVLPVDAIGAVTGVETSYGQVGIAPLTPRLTVGNPRSGSG
jgi:hypothetical protein